MLMARGVAAAVALVLLFLSILKVREHGAKDSVLPVIHLLLTLAWVRRPQLMAMLPAAVLASAAGVFNAMGHISYVYLATQGSMAVAVVLVDLFPAVVVLLAVIVLKERILPRQYAGIAASATGVLVVAT